MNNILNADWFVLQTIAGKEKKIEELVNKLHPVDLKPYLPRKQLKIKKNKKTREMVLPLYPGYLFIVGEWNPEEAKNIQLIPGAIKFIGGMTRPGMLQAGEKEIILKIAKDGIIGYSKVMKDGSKIRIISGPLKELEGTIESVDRRKERAMVRLSLLNRTIRVSLGFEYINVEGSE